MRALSAFVMRGRYQAVAAIVGFAAASLILPPISLLSTALLALVALRKGAKESAWVLLFSVLAVGLAGALLTGNALSSILYGLALWTPVWPIAIILRETRRLDWAMETASVVGLLGVVAVYGMVDDPSALWRAKLQSFVQAMLENAPAGFDAATTSRSVEIFSHYMTGAIAGGSVLSLILGLLIARWQQAALFNPGGFRSEFVNLRLHLGMVLAGIGSIAAGLLGGGHLAEIAWNLNGVFLVLFTIGGFSILHAVLTGRSFWIVGVYLALLVVPQLLLPLIALLGLSDIWLDWRKYARRA